MECEIKTSKKIEISREDFEDYERVRIGGLTNMFIISNVVALSDSLTPEKVRAIISNYDELLNEFPDVNKSHADYLRREVIENLKD